MNYEKVLQIIYKTKDIVFNNDLRSNVSLKGEADYLTAVDVEISAFLKEELKKLDKNISFMSEEDKNDNLTSDRWILDPIDGTTNLVYNYNLSSVSLAHMKNSEIVFGVVYNPFTNETFYAIKGQGAFYNGVKLEQIKDRPLKECLIEFGAGSTIKEHADNTFEVAKQIFKDCLDLRRMCSSALAMCYVASGKLNGYFERRLKPWDYSAGYLILSECGGKISNFNGENLGFDKDTTLICGSKTAYEYLLEKVKKM